MLLFSMATQGFKPSNEIEKMEQKWYEFCYWAKNLNLQMKVADLRLFFKITGAHGTVKLIKSRS